MKQKFLFDIFVDKGLKFRFLFLKLNINSKISVKHDKILCDKFHAVGNMYIIACDVNTFAKSLWSAVNNSVWWGLYVTTRLRSFINCRVNQDRTSNWKRDFLIDCVFFNNILIQILRFAYFPVTNSKGKNSFHRLFKVIEIKVSVSYFLPILFRF